MTLAIKGRRVWEGGRDEEGHREYEVEWLIFDDTGFAGPAAVMNCPGLPLPGSSWGATAILFHGDFDFDAWCRPHIKVKRHQATTEKGKWWTATQRFGTKPLPHNAQRCGDVPVGNPLLEPPKISGKSVNFKEEATTDRFGFNIVNSAWEQLRGAQVEFDRSTGTMTIEQNVSTFFLAEYLPSLMMNRVNEFPLWGHERRCVKLSDRSFDRKYFGFCGIYYTRSLTFEINDDTFDRELLDEGSRVLHGHWDVATGSYIIDDIPGFGPPDRFNPTHFDRVQDRKGNVTKIVLDGYGLPAENFIGPSGRFMSIVEPNLNNPLVDGANWVSITGVIEDWNILRSYDRGDIVRPGAAPLGSGYEGFYFIKVVSGSPGDQPPSILWAQLPPILAFRGEYSSRVSYFNGDFVVLLPTYSFAGRVIVEKYKEADFLLLGVPAVFI